MSYKLKKANNSTVQILSTADVIQRNIPSGSIVKRNGSRYLAENDNITLLDFLKTDIPEIILKDGTVYDVTTLTDAEFFSLLVNEIFDNASEIFVRDQSTAPVIANFNQVQASTTLAAATEIDDTTITVASATGIEVGSYLVIFSNVTNRFFITRVTGIGSAPVIDIDTPVDSVLPIGTAVDITSDEMSVDGSTTAEVFGLRGTDRPTAIPTTFDITRIIFTCLTDTAVNLAKFGDITALTNGLVLRKRDGTYQNIFNVKSNAEIASLLYDWTPYLSTNPVQGQDGFVARLTFSGQEKLGVVVRIKPGEDLEFLVRDDLTDITSLKITAEGHVKE